MSSSPFPPAATAEDLYDEDKTLALLSLDYLTALCAKLKDSKDDKVSAVTPTVNLNAVIRHRTSGPSCIM